MNNKVNSVNESTEILYFNSTIIINYHNVSKSINIICDLSVFDVLILFNLDLKCSIDTKFISLVPTNSKPLQFIGKGISSYIDGNLLISNNEYTLVTDPPNIFISPVIEINNFIIYCTWFSNRIEINLTGSNALLRHTLSLKFSISDEYFNYYGLIDKNNNKIPFIKHESNLELININNLIKNNEYILWFEDKREKLISLLSENDLDEIKSIFEELDADGSGEVDQNELEEYLNKSFANEEARLNTLYENNPIELDKHLKLLLEEKKAQTKSFFAKSSNNKGVLNWNDFLLSEVTKYIDRKKITLYFGFAVSTLTIKPNSDLISVELTAIMNNEQMAALEIQGVADRADGKFLPFEIDRTTGYKIIKNKFLVNNGKYDVLFTDNRELFVAQLTEDQFKNVKDEFNEFDTYKRGFITIKQVEHYYARKLEQDRVDYANANISSYQLDFFISRQKEFYSSCVDAFKALDINNDQTISYDEYLNKAASNPEKYSDIKFTLRVKIINEVKKYYTKFNMINEIDTDIKQDVVLVSDPQINSFLSTDIPLLSHDLNSPKPTFDIVSTKFDEVKTETAEIIPEFSYFEKHVCYRYTNQIPLHQIKSELGENIYHQQFWRALHLVEVKNENEAVDPDSFEDDGIIYFDKDNFSNGYVLSISKISPNKTYEFIREDLRQTALKLLPVDGWDDARSRFDAIDADKSGSIDIKEAETLFNKRSADAINKAYRNFSDNVEKLEIALKEAEELKRSYDGFMKSFSHGNDNNNITIRFDAFVAAHAYFIYKDQLEKRPTGYYEDM